jgi:thiol:disulfide interchange protein
MPHPDHPSRRLIGQLLLAASLSLAAGWAPALTLAPYTAAALAQAQQAGQPVALHFHATWCPTCKAQDQAFKAMQADAKSPRITILVADYDTEVALKKQYKVRQQSTLIVFKGTQEKARVTGETQAEALALVLQEGL